MAIEEDPPAGIPEWVVTFGDMMSLLLTFFILLASMSEIKQNDKFQGVADSMHEQFGYDSSMSHVPGEMSPRNSSMAAMALTGRAKRAKVVQGGVKSKGTTGENQHVRIVRPGDRTTIGTVVYFSEDSATLSEDAEVDLLGAAETFAGKPQKIELRGHTSRGTPAADSVFKDNWELAYKRSLAVMHVLVDRMKIDPKRIRISVAGPFEPVHTGIDPEKLKQNPRVEVFLLEELADDLDGTPDDKKERYEFVPPATEATEASE
ncbi:OmpA/MotB domain protein [Pirellula staleyi DSM 6068]|uniref:OmpA/MotB domain protein n=1 Tax=Pirellula staleyi (strain ATCC 27377 / DSM 6068 / ICPB 4128) TaxID=530564 RepID=D2R536_PIRSD|nr:flagellar motor protein MotB [Pirellula staleyi]ADB18998.1 OmpA/MotB domain protein [Pirellula staleyi DSM 6068]